MSMIRNLLVTEADFAERYLAVSRNFAISRVCTAVSDPFHRIRGCHPEAQ